MRDANARLTLHMSAPSGLVHKRDGSHFAIALRVEDTVSGQTVAMLEVPPATFLDLLTHGAEVDVDGWLLLKPELQARLGKGMEHDEVAVPDDVQRGIRWDADWEAILREWAARLPDADEWDRVEPRRTNAGLRVIRRRWRKPVPFTPSEPSR